MILVTGATGLVGSHLMLQLLETNQSVTAIYRSNGSIQKVKMLFALYNKTEFFERINWIEADIIDVPSLKIAFQNIEYVYHCAAVISFDPIDEDLLRKVNIEGTANVVNFCLQYGVKKLCHVSSIAALGDKKTHEQFVTETTEWNPEKPHSDYAISKYGAEMEIWRGQQEGLDVVIVNPGVILGPAVDAQDWKTGSREIFSRVAKGLPFYTKGATGFTTVNDVVKIMVWLMNSDIIGLRFIVVSKNITFEKILTSIAEALQVKPPFLYGKPWMTNVGWRMDWFASLFGRKRTLSRMMAQTLHNTELFSNENIKNVMAYKFEDLEDYIKLIAAQYPKK
jgi:dihydroflavonol-4-reductase